jgi:hypothetical protein
MSDNQDTDAIYKDALLTPDKIITENTFTSSSLDDVLKHHEMLCRRTETARVPRKIDPLVYDVLTENTAYLHDVVDYMSCDFERVGYLNTPNMLTLFEIIAKNVTIEVVPDDDDDVNGGGSEDEGVVIMGGQNH